MSTSMNSAVSGLRANQVALDVIANNVANASTPGFKAGRATFSDILSETLKGATAPTDNMGGTAPQQVGLGVQVTGGISNLFTQGGINTTNKSTDLAIQGEGFFVLSNGTTNLYTRAGTFEVDAAGNLVDSVTGYRVQGSNGNILISASQTSPPVATTTTTFGGNLDSTDTTGSTYSSTITINDSLGGTHTLTATFTKAGADIWTYGVSEDDSTMSIASGGSGALAFTDTGAISSAATAVGTGNTFSSLGGKTLILEVNNSGIDQTVTFAATDDTAEEVAAAINAQATGVTATVTPEGTIQIISNTAGTTAQLEIKAGTANATLGFPNNSTYTAASTASGTITLNYTNGAASGAPISLDFGSADNTTAVTGFASASTLAQASQTGSAAGTLQSFSIGTDGTINGNFSNGRVESLGKIRLASFNNPAGLEKMGNNLYRETPDSGMANVGDPGVGGRGTLIAGALEGSNVDLADEFTKLIIAQRGFQANARVITTSDEVMQEVVNLKR